MADIPLKSDDEMTNDLVGAVENIAQSVKAGSRDFTKSFNGLTTAIKKLQTTLVNAIKAIKIQVVSKPEKAQKPAVKDKPTSTKEVVKEKETKTEVKPEPKAKAPKIEAAKVDVPKQPKQPKVVDPEVEAEKQKAKKQKQEDADLRSQKLRDQAKIIALRLEEALKPKPVKEAKPPKEPKPPKELKAAKEPKKIIDPQEKERIVKEKAREKEIEKRQEKVRPVKISSLIEGINQTGDAWSKMISGVRDTVADIDNARKAEEKKVEKAGKEGTKEFVGPLKKDFEENERKKVLPTGPEFVGPSKDLFNRDQKRQKDEEEVKKLGKEGTKVFVGPPKKLFENDEKATADAAAQAIAAASDAAAKAIEDAAKRKEKAEEDAAKAEKVLRDYFRKKQEKEAQESLKAAQESAKAANDLIKQQEQAAKQLEQANQRTKKELDSMIAGFQSFSPLFRGPLVNYGLKMMAKGIGYKQPKEQLDNDVSYLAGGGDASNPMKPKGTDTQPAMLTPGEFVVNKKASQDPENKKQLESINSGKNKRKLGDNISGSFLKSVISQYKQGKDAPKTEYRSSGGSIGGGGSSGVGYYASGGSVGGTIAAAIVNIGGTVSSIIKSAKSLTLAGAASAALGVAFNSVTQSVKIANQALAIFGPMVSKANPALMQKLEIVMNDLSGVIGRALVPAVEYLTPLLKKYADYVDFSMKKLTPSINKSAVAFDNIASPLLDFGAVLYSVIGPVLDKFALIIVGITNVIKPIIEFLTAFTSALVRTIGVLGEPIVYVAMATLSGAFNLLTIVIKTTLGIIQTLLGAFVNIVGLIIQGLGKVISYIPLMGDVGESIAKGGEAISRSGESLKKGKPAEEDRIKKGSSVGAAVREVSSTSIAGVGDEVRKNALMAASGAKTQEDMLGDIAGKLDKNNLADAFAEGIKKANGNKPQAAPPVALEGKIPGALNKQEKFELGV
jgi:hypothetical protein